MYWAAISLPRRPGPRPSRRSSARNLTWARIFSGSMEASAALTAGGMVWAGALAEMVSRNAASATAKRIWDWIEGNGFGLLKLLLLRNKSNCIRGVQCRRGRLGAHLV